MQESIVFLLRVQYRREESSRSLSHLLMSFLLDTGSGSEVGMSGDRSTNGRGGHKHKNMT